MSVAMPQIPAASPNSPACHAFPAQPSESDVRPHTMPHTANSVLVLMMDHEIGWNRRVPGSRSARNPLVICRA
nr:MAG TPA: hypothetical protein [Caudoviricetes sp.]DAK60863.1 MAG TPA: hypothetical protein [Caudoviricetes sp.]